jgi:hypothetical protein
MIKHPRVRRIGASCALAALGLLPTVGLAACGTSAPRGEAPWGDAVVRIGRHTISKAALAHWTAVESAINYGYKGNGPATTDAEPDPPSYRHCIANLAATAPSGTKPAQLKGECEQEHEAVEHHILEILITNVWMHEEAHADDVAVSRGEVEREIRQAFPVKAEFDRFLAVTGESSADARYIMESKLLTIKLQRKRGEGLAGQVLARWTPRTSCRAAYVIPGCKQYKPQP